MLPTAKWYGRRRFVPPTSAGVSYDADAATLFAAMTSQPDATRKGLINTLILALKSSGTWAKLDLLYVLAAHDAQAARLNWKSPSTFALTAVNSPTFTTDRGYAGNGSTSYLSTGWVPSTNGVNFVRDDAAFGSYLNAGTDTAASVTAWGNAASPGARIRPRNTGDNYNAKLNSNDNANAGTTTTRLGLTCLQRTSSTATEAFRNGSSAFTQTDTSDGLPATSFFMCCANDGSGGLNSPLDNRVAAAFAGGSLTSGQNSSLYSDLVSTFLTTIGAN